jgi:hypothetical protein
MRHIRNPLVVKSRSPQVCEEYIGSKRQLRIVFESEDAMSVFAYKPYYARTHESEHQGQGLYFSTSLFLFVANPSPICFARPLDGSLST